MDIENIAEWVVGIGFVGIVLVFIIGTIFISNIGATNGGEHTGYITAVEQEGVIWKTWKAYVKTDPQSSQEDSYCVKDDSVISQLKDEAKKRSLVTVSYSAPFVVFNWECGGEGSIIRSMSLDK